LDNLHGWITDPYIPKDGKIVFLVPTQQGVNIKVLLEPSLVQEFEKDTSDKLITAAIWKIDGYKIIA
jgi:hypothetical protein